MLADQSLCQTKKKTLGVASQAMVLAAVVHVTSQLGMLSIWQCFGCKKTIGWVTFYFHCIHLGILQGNVNQSKKSSTYLMGWLRDYLCGYIRLSLSMGTTLLV